MQLTSIRKSSAHEVLLGNAGTCNDRGKNTTADNQRCKSGERHPDYLGLGGNINRHFGIPIAFGLWGLTMGRPFTALIAAAGLLIAGSVADAADMPAKAPAYKAPPPVIAYRWTGFYVGLNAGYNWANVDVDWLYAPGFPSAPADIAAATAGAVGTLHPKGFTGGGQIGYNWQITNVVLGAEADVEYLGGSDSRFVNLAAVGLPAGTTQTETVKSRWLATFRGRLGWALDRVLVYATGGLAVGRISYSDLATYTLGLQQSASSDTTKAGWTAGAGIEYAITPNWTVRGEYLYVDLGSTSYTSVFTPSPAAVITHNHDYKTNIARFGLNYKFN